MEVASVEAFMEASMEVASVEAPVEAFMEASVEVASVEASVEACVEASISSMEPSMKAFASFHQNADSAGGPVRASTDTALSKILNEMNLPYVRCTCGTHFA